MRALCVLLCIIPCIVLAAPPQEEQQTENAVREEVRDLKSAIKEEAQKRALARAEALSWAYSSGAGDPIFSLLRPYLAVGFEARPCGGACLPQTTVRFGAEIALSLWVIDIWTRGGGGVNYYQEAPLSWYGWGQGGVRHNLAGVVPVALFVDIASNPYSRVSGLEIESGSNTEIGGGIEAGGKLGGSAMSVWIRLAAPHDSQGVERYFSALVGVSMVAPPIRGWGSRQ